MHWQEACRISKKNKATRKTHDGRVVERYVDSSTYIEVRNSFRVRRAFASECEGFLDWEPV